MNSYRRAPARRRVRGLGRCAASLLLVVLTAGLPATTARAAAVASASRSAAAPAPTPAPTGPKPSAVRTATTAESRASALARSSGKPVTVEAETDEESQVQANPDGTFTLTENPTPVRAKRGGSWVPIDATLSRRPDGSVQPAATAVGVAFSGGGTGAMVTLTSGAKTLSFHWPSPLPVPTLSGATATYPAVVPGVDLQLTANSSGFSQLLIVHNAQAARNPALKRLALTLAGTGLAVSTHPDGTAVAADAAGKEVFHSDPAVMWDSSTRPDSPPAPHAALAADTSGGRMAVSADQSAHKARVAVVTTAHTQTLIPDQSLLTSPSTVWPVAIDPSWSGPQSQQHWARISDNGWNIYDSTSTATNDHPREGYDSTSFGGNGEKARTYYQMDTSGVEHAIIINAYLYENDAFAAKWSTMEPVNMEWTCDPAGWNSSGLYWSKQPCWLGVVDTQYSEELGCPNACYVSPSTLKFTATKEVASAASGGASHMSFALVSPDENNSDEWKQFASGGGATLSVTYSVRPQLLNSTGDPKINGAVTDSGKTFVSTPTPTLSARAYDSDGEGVQMQYNLKNSAGTQIATGWGPASGTTTNGTDWTTPTLSDGTYSWQAADRNALGYWDGYYSGSTWVGTFTAAQTFTVDTSPPSAPGVTSPQFPPGVFGSAYTDTGTFSFSTSGDNVKGYVYSLDGDLSGMSYNAASPPPALSGTITKGKAYWATADNGTGVEAVNGWAKVAFAPGTVGPHHVFVRAVDQAGNIGPETGYLIYAGFTTPTFAYGDKLVNGDSSATPPVPAGTYSTASSTNTALNTYGDCCGLHYADGYMAKFWGSALAVGDQATFSFAIPQTGIYDIGANLVKSADFGQYSLVLDRGSANSATLTSSYDAYNSSTVLQYKDFGAPRASGGAALTLAAGIHTLTLTITGKNSASSAYQAGIDFLRISPMSATCPLSALSGCFDNTAISQPTDTGAADADGLGNSFSATDLANAGWKPGTPVTVDGAPMTVPSYAAGTADNIVSSGQTITVPGGAGDAGNALVFLGTATDGAVTGTTGTITYAGYCGSQTYTIDTVPDWVTGASTAAAVAFPHRDTPGNQQAAMTVQLFAVAVPLDCPGQAITSISLPVVSNGVVSGVPALHIFGVGIRPSSYSDAPTDSQNWTGTWSARQDYLNNSTLTSSTVRIPAHVSIGNNGGTVRIHVSNAVGATPVKMDDVSIAVQSSGAVPTATPVRLTFNGSTSLSLPAGGDAVSDPVSLPVAQQSTLLISMYVTGTVSPWPAHASSQETVYISTPNTDAALDATGTPFTATGSSTTSSIPYLTAVDVTSPGSTTGSLVLYGDQTVNADTAPGDGAHHLSDLVAADLAAGNGGTVPYGVLSAGRDSWTATNNLLPSVTGAAVPQSAADPMDRDVLEQTNVRTVLISTGTADILAGESATTIENRLIAASQQLRHFYTDDSSDAAVTTNNAVGLLTVYVATIPPSSAFTTSEESVREAVNAFINGSSGAYLGGNADGVIDFAAAVSSTGTDAGTTVNPAYFYASNGTYYPDESYYEALAEQFIVNTTTSSTVGIKPMAQRL